ncbi:hypothetical protein PI23P_09635 [Polaribacter irgensii 23-P]|uniref:Uncharacterized protein n=1 Tax=Polaribacter irgensii 23-P TaxID=313594 RepID=A4C0D6_9FLAO|nr:hypothetical protein PI23P_09635 [Polaribacter irgensii 23-P]
MKALQSKGVTINMETGELFTQIFRVDIPKPEIIDAFTKAIHEMATYLE